jgi:hypothetical protein
MDVKCYFVDTLISAHVEHAIAAGRGLWSVLPNELCLSDATWMYAATRTKAEADVSSVHLQSESVSLQPTAAQQL